MYSCRASFEKPCTRTSGLLTINHRCQPQHLLCSQYGAQKLRNADSPASPKDEVENPAHHFRSWQPARSCTTSSAACLASSHASNSRPSTAESTDAGTPGVNVPGVVWKMLPHRVKTRSVPCLHRCAIDPSRECSGSQGAPSRHHTKEVTRSAYLGEGPGSIDDGKLARHRQDSCTPSTSSLL